jgi:hypothetical protein
MLFKHEVALRKCNGAGGRDAYHCQTDLMIELTADVKQGGQVSQK